MEYRPHARHFWRTDRIPSVLPMELPFASLRGQGLDHAGGRLLELLFRVLVVRRAHDEAVFRRPDVLDLHGDAVRLHRGLCERLLDVDRPVRTEVHRLDVAVDRHMGRDDVLPGDLDERVDPGTLEVLALADVVADVLDPPGGDLRDVDEALLGLVLVQGDERAEVLHVRHGADDEVALVGPVVAASGGRLRLRHYSRTPRTSPRIAAFPPVGFATVAPQTGQRTTLAARSNTICTLPQSSHLTRRNWLVGFGITCAPPRARTSSRGCRAAGGPCGIPGTGTADGSASSVSRGPRASVGGSLRTPRSPVGTGAGPPAVRTAGGS